MPGGEAMRRAGIEPLRLQAKEGLALLNGTQGMSAVAGLALFRAERLARSADVAGAMTPVPGGVGPLTIALLLKNTLVAAESRARR